MPVIRKVLAVLFAVMGLFLAVQGVRLALLGGSLYYVLVGTAYLVSAWWIWRGDRRAVWIVGLAFAATLVWAFVEVGANY